MTGYFKKRLFRQKLVKKNEPSAQLAGLSLCLLLPVDGEGFTLTVLDAVIDAVGELGVAIQNAESLLTGLRI